MSKKMVIVFSGKKQSGKSSSCNYVISKYLNAIEHRMVHDINNDGSITKSTYSITKTGELVVEDNYDYEQYAVNMDGIIKHSVKTYSFADPLKKFLIDILNVPYSGCYGTDVEKNTPVPHILWENFPRECRPIIKKIHESKHLEFSGTYRDSWTEEVPKTGPMTGREIMQAFGTDIIRKIYGDCWARGTYNLIKNETYKLSLVGDCRFPNEVNLGSEVNAKTIRLLRNISKDSHPSEIALDSYPHEKYTLVVDNSDMTLKEQCEYLDPFINQWFEEAEII